MLKSAVTARVLVAGALVAVGLGGMVLVPGTASAAGTGHGRGPRPRTALASGITHVAPSQAVLSSREAVRDSSPVVAARSTSAQPEALVSLVVSYPTVVAGGSDTVEVTEQPLDGADAVTVGVDQTPTGCVVNGGGPIQIAVPQGDATGSYNAGWGVQVNCSTTIEGYVVLSNGVRVTSAPQQITVVQRSTPTPPPDIPAGSLAATFRGPLPNHTSRYGSAVAVSGSTAVVGDFFENHNTGAAFVYTRTPTGWVQTATLHGAGAGPGSTFGTSVAIAGSTIIVGASFRFGFQYGPPQDGAVYVFSKSGSGWVQTQELSTTSVAPPDGFGSHVAATTNTLAILNAPLGIRSTNANFLYLYSRGPNGWSLHQLLSSTADLPCSLAMSSATIAVGACDHDTTQLNYVQLFDNVTGQWQPTGHLSGSASFTGGGYGSTVAVSDSEIAVGAPNLGEVFTYQPTSTGWGAQDVLVGEVPFGTSLALDGSQLDVTDGDGVTSSRTGPVDVYTLAPPGWRGIGVLQVPSAPDGFGEALAAAGTLTLVGAPGVVTTSVPGAAFLFQTPSGVPPAPAFTTYTRIAGQTADATAAAELEHQFASGACPGTTGTRSVVVATDATYPDALASAYLARSLGTGTLLTPTGSLSQATEAAIRTEGITQVDVVGGPLAVSTAVLSQLEALPAYACGGATPLATGKKVQVTRIWGTTQYTTAEDTAEKLSATRVGSVDLSGAYAAVNAQGGDGAFNDTSGSASTAPAAPGALPTAIVATGQGFQDAEAASTLAYADSLPILLTTPTALSAQTSSAIATLGIKQVIVMGGPLAVSNAVVAGLEGLGVSVLRVAGQTYTDTSVQLAMLEMAPPTAGFGWAGTGGLTVARGNGFTDGLAGAVVAADGPAASSPEPLVLTTSPTIVGAALASYLKTAGTAGIGGAKVTHFTVLGGSLAITKTVIDDMGADL